MPQHFKHSTSLNLAHSEDVNLRQGMNPELYAKLTRKPPRIPCL